MSDRLSRDLRRHAEAIFEDLPPLDDLLPADMAAEHGIHQDHADLAPFASGYRMKRRLGWRVALVAAFVVLLGAVPTVLWLTGSDSQDVEPATVTTTLADDELIAGAYLYFDASGSFAYGQGAEVLEFSVTGSGGYPGPDGAMSAIGQVELSSSSATVPTWFAQGRIVCIRPLTESVEGQSGDGIFEVRYAVITTNRPGFSEGDYASLYVGDTGSAESAGESSGDPSGDASCRPRQGVNLEPLRGGRIEVKTP